MKIYLAGGAVRDALLGRTVQDLDYVVLGGSEAELLASVRGLVRVGRDLPVYVRGDRQYTLSSFASIEEDLASRDLTINALARDEAGQVYAHPQAERDLSDKVLRPVAAANFLADPLRALRGARFAAQFPDFTVHEELLAAMRGVGQEALGRVAAERVGQELLKACSAPRPGNLLRVLERGECLAPWLTELEQADRIPAGPAAYHAHSVLGHTARVMDACAGNAQTVWMALCHDLGKTTTPQDQWPRHFGHEEQGEAMAKTLGERLRLPKRIIAAGALAARWHMSGGMYHTLRASTRVKLLVLLHKHNLLESFFHLVQADGDRDFLDSARQELAAILAVRLPEKHQNRGPQSADILLQLRCEALDRASSSAH